MSRNKLRYDQWDSPVSLDLEAIRSILSPFSSKAIKSFAPLSGGFKNSNFRINFSDDPTPIFLKISNNKLEEFEKELSVLKRIDGIVPSPIVRYQSTYNDFPLAIMDFIEGKLLSHVLDINSLDSLVLKTLAFDLGIQLAKIHSIKLSQSGLFDKNFNFTLPFSHFGKEFYQFIINCLHSKIAQKRMGTKLNKDILTLLQDHKKVFINLNPNPSLIHCDFNGKNILINNSKITAIIDWEFAMAGSALVDFGNFFRFEEDYPPFFEQSFIKAYESKAGPLPKNWKKMSKLLDLASMCSFITREMDLPKTQSTALRIFKKTLNEL